MTDALRSYGAAVREAAARVCDDMVDMPLDQIPAAAGVSSGYEIGVRRGLVAATNGIRAMPLPAPAQAQSDELARLRNLLAVIHGDGGHHTAAVGLTQSANDAARIVHGLRARLAAAEQAAKERGEALRQAECSHTGMMYGDDKSGRQSEYARGFGDCLKFWKESQPRGKTDDH